MELRSLLLLPLILLVTPSAGDECLQAGICSEGALEESEVRSLYDCWMNCRRNDACTTYTYLAETGECSLFDECGELSQECQRCQTGTFTCVPEQGFELLVFGGSTFGSPYEVRIYRGVSDTMGCQLQNHPSRLDEKPFGGLMDGNVTTCGGGPRNCHYLDLQVGQLQWVESYGLVADLASHVATYDFNQWTFFGGYDRGELLMYWELGNERFQIFSMDFELGANGCATRFNRSHAILSTQREGIFWYQEEGQLLEQWNKVELAPVSKTACGMLHDVDGSSQYAMAGGVVGNEGYVHIQLFDFEQNGWTVGQTLPYPIWSAATIQYQNSFLVVGGNSDQGELTTVLQYNAQEGWTQLPMTLREGNYDVGVTQVPPGLIPCNK